MPKNDPARTRTNGRTDDQVRGADAASIQRTTRVLENWLQPLV